MDIRKNMLRKHKEYMRDHSDRHYNEMNIHVHSMKARLDELNEQLPEDGSNEALHFEKIKQKLKTLERTRDLLVWLDNSTVANHGYLVCLVTFLYDPAIFYSPFREQNDTCAVNRTCERFCACDSHSYLSH